MNRYIFLLSTFLSLTALAQKESFNAETLGLSRQYYDQVIAQCKKGTGPRAMKEIAALLPDRPKPDCSDEKAFQEYTAYKNEHYGRVKEKLSSWKNWAAAKGFHYTLGHEEAVILAQAKQCPNCEELGPLVAGNTELSKLFPKIVDAQQKITAVLELEQKIAKDEAAEQEAKRRVREDYRALHAAKDALRTPEPQQQDSLLDTVTTFLKEKRASIDRLVSILPSHHACDDHQNFQ